MKLKTSDLKGAALDWAVAQCEGLKYPSTDNNDDFYTPSTSWAQGGPIIEREVIDTWFTDEKCAVGGMHWAAYSNNKKGDNVYGPTPLIAAMRCYCASKLGDEVEVPNELA